jgi:hypothetical protein
MASIFVTADCAGGYASLACSAVLQLTCSTGMRDLL